MDADRRQLGPRNPQGVVGAGLCMCATAIAGRVEMGVAVERRAAGGLRDGHRNESGHRSGGALQEAASRCVRPPQPPLTAGIASRIDLGRSVFEEAFHGQAVESVEGNRVAEAVAAV